MTFGKLKQDNLSWTVCLPWLQRRRLVWSIFKSLFWITDEYTRHFSLDWVIPFFLTVGGDAWKCYFFPASSPTVWNMVITWSREKTLVYWWAWQGSFILMIGKQTNLWYYFPHVSILHEIGPFSGLLTFLVCRPCPLSISCGMRRVRPPSLSGRSNSWYLKRRRRRRHCGNGNDPSPAARSPVHPLPFGKMRVMCFQ